MATRIDLNPVTRQNGLSRIAVEVEGGRVREAWCGGLLMRGFEQILLGRHPEDAPYLTARVCGICSTAHAVAAALALEDASPVEVPPNGVWLRNLILGADLLQNHIRHLHIMALPDFVPGLNLFGPAPTRGDFRLTPRQVEEYRKHHEAAVAASRQAHEMAATFAGRIPHHRTIMPGGNLWGPTSDRILRFRQLLDRVYAFIRDRLVPGIQELGELYPDYYQLGSRPANFLNFAMFPQPAGQGDPLFPAGAVIEGRWEKVDLRQITEDIRYSWYDEREGRRRALDGRPQPALSEEKADAYSWVKAPRYRGQPMEGGPLARLWLKGFYRRGVSVLDRLMARALETKLVAEEMYRWLDALQPGQPSITPWRAPRRAEGIGLTGAMRGPLAHYVRIENYRIAGYQIITPSAWNLSPRDNEGRRGPAEEALLGTPVRDPHFPVELGRVYRSFDPCNACSTHLWVLDAAGREVGRVRLG
ncbi:MAG: nickel-dependent hydrogenase large subunit [Bacillota bacterium]|nr:nickel-dependent hydrogenase large subunit [Bacillota bacterium]